MSLHEIVLFWIIYFQCIISVLSAVLDLIKLVLSSETFFYMKGYQVDNKRRLEANVKFRTYNGALSYVSSVCRG